MRKVNKFLLVIFSVRLAISGFLTSKAQDLQIEKEEAVLFLIARVNVLNGYYGVGKFKNEKHSLKNYEEMLSVHTNALTERVQSFKPKIKFYSDWARLLLIIAILGNTVVLVIEAIREK